MAAKRGLRAQVSPTRSQAHAVSSASAASRGATVAAETAGPPKARQIHKAGEVNISAYFPAEVKASLRMVQAKTGYNLKDCLAEALHDLFRKHNAPVSVEFRKPRRNG